MQPQDLNIEAFNTLVKDIRNTHRTATDPKNDTANLEQRKVELAGEVAKAAKAADIDTMNAKSADLRRVVAKLKDGPQEAIDKFTGAMEQLNALLAGEAPVSEAEVKEAA